MLERTIVGRDCYVGSGAVVIESHLWAGTTHTHTHTHIYAHTHTHTLIYAHIHAHTHTHAYIQHMILCPTQYAACNHIYFFYFPFKSISFFLLSIRDPLLNHSVRDDARTCYMRCLGCRVEAGAEVNYAILCDGAVVKKGARVGRGCGTCVRVTTFFCYLIKYFAICLYISISTYLTI